jgi:hypothetical protein
MKIELDLSGVTAEQLDALAGELENIPQVGRAIAAALRVDASGLRADQVIAIGIPLDETDQTPGGLQLGTTISGELIAAFHRLASIRPAEALVVRRLLVAFEPHPTDPTLGEALAQGWTVDKTGMPPETEH